MTDPRDDVGRNVTYADATHPIGAGWGWVLASGIVSAILGLMAFAWPFSATIAATLIIGAFLLAAGAVSIGAGIFGRGHEGRVYATLLGIVALVIGLVMIFEPATGALSLTLLVAIWLGARGALELYWGTKSRRHRGMLIALGLVNILLALFVLGTMPWSALTLPGYILGISFLFGGITSIISALAHRKGAAAFAV
ncbi:MULTISPECIES: HdeD family acid-resistance protein [unclassified Sphingomonas]|uniref:HdeD family acid-resistance protein n=1 Tax=unclassified Sphingomonas TaxID=196159 RepID=UPI00226A0959|nr:MULTISPECIES: HdeD family acid-resistance protein [unclassified Sphingomonas]